MICACGKKLTAEERHYYTDQCEACVTDWHERIQAWRKGGEDTELDAMYSIPKQPMN